MDLMLGLPRHRSPTGLEKVPMTTAALHLPWIGNVEASTLIASLALIVSLTALAFTVGSFWWLQARSGKLRTWAPPSYAGAFTPENTIVSLPLPLYNPAPAPKVVLDFRLTLSAPNETHTLRWSAIQPGLRPAEVGGGRVLPSPLVVAGRTVSERFIEFHEKAMVIDLKVPHAARVDIKVGGGRWWRKAGT